MAIYRPFAVGNKYESLTTSRRISTSSSASQPRPYQRDGVRKIRQRSQKGKLKNQCFQQFRVLNCAQTPLIIHGCNQHQQTVILIPIKGGFANILFLTFLTVASILWRPAPWYGWVLEAGDDENGLLQVPGHPYFMPPSNSKKYCHLAPSNQHVSDWFSNVDIGDGGDDGDCTGAGGAKYP